MRQAPLILAAVGFLFGCGTPHYWTKAGATVEDFRRENYECIKEATSDRASWKPYVGFRSGQEISADLHRVCMQARGYQGPTWSKSGQAWHDGR
jgi:hypothetical protein